MPYYKYMNRRIIITGINGFVGHHLARELSSRDITVIGIGYDQEAAPDLKDIIDSYHAVDLTTEWPVIEDVDAIIHLAGLAVVGASFEKPQAYISANSAMVTNMCEYYLKQEKTTQPRIIIVSTGTIYSPKQPMPITEDGTLDITSPYTISKVLNENQATYYRNRGLDCVIVRPFNHIGPGQAPGFILPDFYKKISEAQPGSTIMVGNINTRRDYTDVRDIVDAYARLALAPKLDHHLYNACSGKSVAGSELLEIVKDTLGKKDINLEIDPTLVRPTDIMDIYGDSSRLRDELGWQPTHTLDQTVRDFVADASK